MCWMACNLGFTWVLRVPAHLSQPRRTNWQYPSLTNVYLANEVALNRVAGPLPSHPVPNLLVSSFGVIPKKGQPGKGHLIVDLSSPPGDSVNNGINREKFSMH